ncbi:MAG: VCBS repeat-containing protein [Candidatus Eisenbacteria sp.]|nr:VCBS repeat-containing protein [Candidatus Eisenbacteria bacterium]
MTSRRLNPPAHWRLLWIGTVMGVTAVLGLASPPAALADWTETFSFDPGDLRTSTLRGHTELRLPGCVVDAEEGAPRLPLFAYTVAVREGEKVVGVEVMEIVTERIPGHYDILPGGGEIPGATIVRDPAIWSGAGPYPEQVVSLGGAGFMGGAQLASVIIHPVQFIPAEGALLFHREIRVRMVTAPSTEVGVHSRRSPVCPASSRTVSGRVVPGRMVEKGLLSGTFQPTEYPSLDGSLVEYLIITVDELAAEFQRLADWKTSCGVPALVKTLPWIEANYPGGVDLPEKIRFFIRDAYEMWGTEWVLLGGDVDQIPIRLAHSDYYAPGDWLITCDMYYQCLDGNWNADGDHLFGEGYQHGAAPGDSADFYPEVFLGRASVQDVSEASNFIDNAMDYRKDPDPGYLTRALFLGEVVFPIGWDPGDPIYLDGSDICEQSAQWFPSDWDTTKLYEINGNENHDAILDEMNAGHGIVVVVNHGDAFKMSTSDDLYLYLSDMDSLQNHGKTGFIYTSNCNLSQIEMDCFNEHLTQNLDRGYIGAIGATRFCFPHAGRDFQEEVFRLLFEAGVTRIGELQAFHKVPFAAVSTLDNSAYRWTVLSYMLLGDPELSLWVHEPETLNVTHAGSMSLGDSIYTVQVTSSGLPVEGLTVCLWKQDTGEYARALTDAAGQVEVSFEPGSVGSASLVVIGDGHVPYEASVSIGGSGRVYVSQWSVDDSSGGNGDGQWDGGETVDLDVTLYNNTTQGLGNVTAVLGLVDGSTVTLDMTFDGLPAPDLLSLGSEGVHPGSLPAVYSVVDEALLGRPHFTGVAQPDTGVFFWLDASGWHVRTVGGLEDHEVWVSVSTDGRALDVEAFGLESADSLWVGTQSFEIFSDLHSADYEDGVDAVFADTVGIAVTSGSASYGTIGAGQGQTRSFSLSALPHLPDRTPVWLILDVSSGADTWTEWIRMDVHGPDLCDYYHGVDDSTYVGNGNGEAEVGEIVILRCGILNRGTGAASAVTATLRGVAGVDVTDSTDVIGNIGPGDLVQASGGFVFTCLSPSMLVSLEIRDGEGRRWFETFELDSPSPPTELEAKPAAEWIDLLWEPSPEEDVFGYNVYRSDGGGPFQRVTERLDEGSSCHRDCGLAPESHFVYRVTAVDTSGNESAPTGTLDIWSAAPQQSGFPVTSMNSFFSSPAIADLDLDGDLEIIVGSKDGFVYAWHHDGQLVAGWPKDTGGEVWSSPALGNLDEDPEPEVVCGTWDKKVFAWNHDGTGLLSPDGVFAETPSFVRSSPVIEDVDSDSWMEVVVGCGNGRLYAWNHDGTGLLQPDGVFAVVGGGEIASSPAVADIDDDHFHEIIVGSLNGNLYVWNSDGTGYLEASGLFAETGEGIWSSPAIGDVDEDGDLEIVAASWSDSVYAWHHDGTRMTGWPVSAQDDVWSSPALGDLDGNGDLEIVIGSNNWKVFAWNHDGTGYLFPNGKLASTTASVWGTPALTDLDEDGKLDIVVGCEDGTLYAWSRIGVLLPGWPVTAFEAIYSSPAIGDLDLDGDIEVISAAYDGMLYVYDLGATLDADAADWPMFQHDQYRSGYHGWSGFLDVDTEDAVPLVSAGLDQNYPNPFNPQTIIAYRVGSAEEVELAVYDVSGRLVTTLVSERQRPGVYRVRWDGENAHGASAASGVYFYRLRVGEENFSKKMVLMK